MRSIVIIAAVLMSLCIDGLADDKVEHGDWSSQFMEGMGEATTHENGMSVFGMLCAENSCRYYFANNTECQPRVTYPMMVTTNEGALAIETVCEKVESANGDVMLYWFNESQTMNQAFAKSPELSFAFPLNNGKFKISSFSMNGFTDAIERMISGLREKTGVRRNDKNS
jgi:hypothetical protein